MSTSASLIKIQTTKFDYEGSIKLYDEEEISQLFMNHATPYENADHYLTIEDLEEMKKQAKTPTARKIIRYWLKVARETKDDLNFSIG